MLQVESSRGAMAQATRKLPPSAQWRRNQSQTPAEMAEIRVMLLQSHHLSDGGGRGGTFDDRTIRNPPNRWMVHHLAARGAAGGKTADYDRALGHRVHLSVGGFQAGHQHLAALQAGGIA